MYKDEILRYHVMMPNSVLVAVAHDQQQALTRARTDYYRIFSPETVICKGVEFHGEPASQTSSRPKII